MTEPYYHNTNKEKGKTLKRSINKAKSQQEIIHDYFKMNFGTWFSSYQVHQALEKEGKVAPNVPHTSIRARITNLCTAGKLKKSDGTEILGLYGKLVHTYTAVAGGKAIS